MHLQCAKLPLFSPLMDCDLFMTMIEHPNDAIIPPDPYFATQVFRWCRIERSFDLDMPVATDLTNAFLVKWKQLRWQRPKSLFFEFKELLSYVLIKDSVVSRVTASV